MDNASKSAIFEDKIQEYYLSCLPGPLLQYLQKDTKVLEQANGRVDIGIKHHLTVQSMRGDRI